MMLLDNELGMIVLFLTENSIPYEEHVELKKKTWIHRGGCARYFISPKDTLQLQMICSWLYLNKIEFDLIGHTSNLYFVNDYNPQIVVSTRSCNKIEIEPSYIICEPGVGVIELSRECVKLGVSGFEYLTELPGTVAAAIYNNSSCKSNSISSLLESIDFLRTDGVIEVLRPDDLGFTYRNSLLKSKHLKGVILTVRLRRVDSDPSYLMSIAESNKKARKAIFDNNVKSLGCVFDNPRLSLFHRIILRLCAIFYRLVRFRGGSVDNFKKKVLLRISGYSELEPYICDKSMIIYNWDDEDADRLFPLYCDFAKKVLHTSDLEIEIKK